MNTFIHKTATGDAPRAGTGLGARNAVWSSAHEDSDVMGLNISRMLLHSVTVTLTLINLRGDLKLCSHNHWHFFLQKAEPNSPAFIYGSGLVTRF